MAGTEIAENLARLQRLWDSGHPDRKAIWAAYEDYILEECLERLETANNEFGPGSIAPEHEAHLQSIVAAFAREYPPKYRKGQREHKGKLWEHSPIELTKMAKEEVLDQWSFLHTLEDVVIELMEENRSLKERLLALEAQAPHHGA